MQSSGPPSQLPPLDFTAKGPTIRSVRNRRLDEFIGGQWGNYNLASVLFEARTSSPEHVRLEVWHAPGLSKPTFQEAIKAEYKPLKKGDTFGPSWSNHWVRVHLSVPKDWLNKERVQLEFDPSCEAMVWSYEGVPLQGITGGSGGDRRVDFPLVGHDRKHIKLYLEVSCNGMFGVEGGPGGDPDPNRYFTLHTADIVVPRMDAWRLMWDFEAIKGLAREMPQDSEVQNRALWVANEIMSTFRKEDLSSILRCRKLAEEILGEGWEAKGEKIYEGGRQQKVWAIGHCHIDTAWLWPFSVTQQKVARSWSSQVDLMDRYPEHVFVCSTAQQYKWLEELYPPLFQKVKAKMTDGRFQPIGGSWVECDANMPSGEAFVRQFLYGQRYLHSRFGQRSNVFWLPDTFGYSSQIPQLARGAGMDYFFTQKLSWSNINKFPHHTFRWVGLDGTQMLVHMTPVDRYDSDGGVGDVRKAISAHKNLDVTSNSLLLFGWGDGGGGPAEKMLESLRRVRATNGNFPEVPKVKVGGSVPEFFAVVEKETKGGSRLPIWQGDLYLEFHRAVYTSHGSIKKGNRRSEQLLHDVEWAATLASLNDATYAYPKDEIDALWEKTLLCQFHDVLPGSSIGMVYKDAEKIYGEIAEKGLALLEEALKALSPTSKALLHGAEEKAFGSVFAVNTTFHPRREVVELPLDPGSGAAIKDCVLQYSHDGKSGLVVAEDTSGDGLVSLRPASTYDMSAEWVSVEATGKNSFVMRNSAMSIQIRDGQITSIVDLANKRELLSKPAGLMIYEDFPPNFDAWEVELYHLETGRAVPFTDVRIVERGPLRGSLLLQAKVGNSTIKMHASLDAISASIKNDGGCMLRFDAEVDWFEKHKFLKFELPTKISSPEAYYETQFGAIARPTTRNTSWEAAKFEVCGHRFADFSESNFGVAIMTDSKYGYATEGSTMRLSLLRGATYPDAHQDEGKHAFAFAIYPHAGHFITSDVPQVARRFNAPLHFRYGAPDVHPKSPFTISGADTVFLDTVKRGEEDDFRHPNKHKELSIILRLYEAFGGHASIKLITNLPVRKASLVNLLEDELKELSLNETTSGSDKNGASISLDFRGFEIKTVKLVLDAPKIRRDSWVKLG